MKLIIQVPCLNEESSLPVTLAALPRELPGIDELEILVIDDGSTDRTTVVAREHGAHHVVGFASHRGLARAFSLGLRTCLELGADIIVNTDADNQYCADDIPKLIAPIIEGRADISIGSRPIASIEHFSPTKKLLQRLGSRVVSRVSGTTVQDAPSGFRAFSRKAAARMNVFSNYTYTLETIIQASEENFTIASVPVRVNADMRPSRLVRGTVSYLVRSLATIIRILVLYRSFRFFLTLGVLLLTAGVAIGGRFLYFYATGDGDGHVQSLILASVLMIFGFQTGLLAFVCELLSVNRRIMEELLEAKRLAGHRPD